MLALECINCELVCVCGALNYFTGQDAIYRPRKLLLVQHLSSSLGKKVLHMNHQDFLALAVVCDPVCV